MGNLRSAVDELLGCDPAALPDVVLEEEIAELRRQIDRCEAAYLLRLAALDRRGIALAEHGSTASWVRTTLRLSPATAHRDVHLARDLVDALPLTRWALADGEISATHAQLIASVRRVLTPEGMAAAEAHLVEVARQVTPVELHGALTHVKNAYAPARLHAEEQNDYANRRLHTTPGIHGNGIGTWQLHPVGHETVMTAIHALSRPIAGDDRTPAQRRADALISIAEIAMRSGELPITGGVKPHASVLVSWETLEQRVPAPAADYALGATSGSEWVRRLLCDAEISRIVTGPAGEILDAGRAVRTFSAAQTRAIVARDRRCIWPGCDRPPGWCEGHHIIHWADGGPSAVDNGALLCGRHHDRVHVYGHAIIPGPGPYRVNLRPGSDPRWKGSRWQGPDHRSGP
ncbi:MAG TPA: DUF222 domain-containing protein [Mycobacteriales bacterium]|nr:DUF222 domain-containing protein [Mycobacteriales bacterium]